MAIPEAFKMSMQKTVQIKDLEIERVKPILWNKLIQKPQGTQQQVTNHPKPSHQKKPGVKPSNPLAKPTQAQLKPKQKEVTKPVEVS